MWPNETTSYSFYNILFRIRGKIQKKCKFTVEMYRIWHLVRVDWLKLTVRKTAKTRAWNYKGPWFLTTDAKNSKRNLRIMSAYKLHAVLMLYSLCLCIDLKVGQGVFGRICKRLVILYSAWNNKVSLFYNMIIFINVCYNNTEMHKYSYKNISL